MAERDDLGEKHSITCWPPDDEEKSDSSVAEFDMLKSLESPISGIQRTRTKEDPKNVHTADVSLARWWRYEGRRCHGSNLTPPTTASPHTAIHRLAKCTTGQQFIKKECMRLKALITSYPSSAKLHASLATFLEKSEEFDEANKHITLAVDFQDEGAELNDYKWLQERIARQARTRHIQAVTSLNLTTKPLAMPQPAKIERRQASTLSVEEFFKDYAMRSTPLVITGLVNQLTTTTWSLQHVRQMAADCKVKLKKLDQSSVEWARLEDAEMTTVGEYVDGLDKQEGLSLHDKRYLFDWSLPLNCPRLAEQLIIPKYFAGDFLQRTAPGTLYSESWPSLFVAPSGLRSELHVDAFGSNFWMAVFQGSKRWLFFDKEDVPFLYPEYPHSMDSVFRVDLTQPDLNKFPLLSLTHPKECVLGPGEVLFVPAGCPHTVTNLAQSLAISANFVDQSNFDLVKRELAINSLIDERASDLLRQFQSESFDKNMDFNIQNTHRNSLSEMYNAKIAV